MTDANVSKIDETAGEDLEKPLEQMTKAELYELATELEIVGRKQLNRDELEAAVRERMAFNEKTGDGSEEGDNEEGDGDEESDEPSEDEGAAGDDELPPETQPGGSIEPPKVTDSDPPVVTDGDPPVVTNSDPLAPVGPALAPTEDQLRRIRQGETAALVEIEKDPDLPDYLRAAVHGELARRSSEEKAKRAREALKSEIKQYRVTKGGRYVCKGYITTLPENSVINHMTHDLEDVKSQGIEFEPLSESRMVQDQLGVPKHIVR